MMLKGLTNKGRTMCEEARSRFCDHLVVQLPESLCDMEPGLVIQLFASASHSTGLRLSERHRQDIDSFTDGHRLYESCLPAIRRLLFECLPDAHPDDRACQALVMKVLQLRSWRTIARFEGLTGKQQAVNRLREYVGLLARRML